MIEKVKKIVETLRKFNVEYLFIGKFGAILYGYPGTTQDIDIFPKKDKTNCENVLKALKELGFALDKNLEDAILAGKDFIQIRGGPFPLDIVFAPDGIESYDTAKNRSKLVEDFFPCASIDDIIESKKRSGRQRDKEELPRLELFREELKKFFR
ncbi:hypothetical protein B9J78_06410 [bacterium Unc6]|nr:hypothetical protein [bacterium Unc6]